MNKSNIILAVLVILAVCVFNLYSRTSELSDRTIQLAEQDLISGNHNLEQQVILNAIGEDYPPKKKLGEREWCKDRTCLNE